MSAKTAKKNQNTSSDEGFETLMETLMDQAESPVSGHQGHAGLAAHTAHEQEVDELIARGIAFEAVEEAKVAGTDGHQAVAGLGAGEESAVDELTEESEGAGTKVSKVSGVYIESAEGETPLEIEGIAAEAVEFGGESYEVVFGNDDRVRIGNTTLFPWRSICKLEITAANGQRMGCSGTLIGPRTVLTSGHCVYMHDKGGWVRNVRVVPGMNGRLEPYGSATSNQFISVKGWVDSKSSNYDYAVIILPSNAKLGNTTGSMGLANLSYLSLLGLNVNTSGYPGDKPAGTQWWNANSILAVTDRRVFYRIDTYGGQSGSAVWRYKDGKRHIVAIHNTGGSVFNGSVRIIKPVFDNLVKWATTYA